MPTAEDVYRRGLRESNSGRYASARRLFLDGLRRSTDAETTARLKLSLAFVAAELGALDEGLALCAEAGRISDVSDQVRGLVRSQTGLLYMRAGDGERALSEFAAAVTLLSGQPEGLPDVYLNRANVYMQRADVPRALADLERAADLFAEGGEAVPLAKARHNLGFTQMLAGDLVTALELMSEAHPTLAALSATYTAVVEQDRAQVLSAAGMAAEAREALTRAVRAYGRRRLRQRQAEAELLLARTLLYDDPAGAASVARRAGRRFAGRGSTVWALRADAVAFAGEVRASGSLASGSLVSGGARPVDSEILDRGPQLADRLWAQGLYDDALLVRLKLARGRLSRGEVNAAAAVLERVHRRRSTAFGVRLLEREVRAELARARGRRTVAMRHVQKGLADLHGWQSSFGSLDLQASLVAHGGPLAQQGVRLALEDGRPDVVFEWSERARALASRVVPVRPPADATAAADLAKLRGLHTRLAVAGGHAPTSLARAEAQLQGRIRERAWYGAGSGLVTEPATLEGVQDALSADDAALVAHLLVGEDLYALVATGRDADVVPLGPVGAVTALLDWVQADLDVAASGLPSTLRESVQSGLDQRLDALAEALIGPVAARIGDRSLVLTPSARLGRVPWSLLPGLRGRTLTVPRSASTWLLRRPVPLTLGSAGLAAGPRVARAEEEVRKGGSAWARHRVLTGAEVTAGAVTDLAGHVDVLHVAAHGRHSSDNPLFSALELTDGPWYGYDIDRVTRVPTVVVLSACELGRSAQRSGEERIGMTTGWLHAGARCVLAATTCVNDDTACEVLAGVHQRLAGGTDPATALAAATAECALPAPSPFVCFGVGW